LKYYDKDAASEILWRSQPSAGHADRSLALRNTPGTIPAEERKSIATNRVNVVNDATDTYHRLESLLEANAMEILMASDPGVRIQAQYGWIKFRRSGLVKRHMFDLLASFSNGCRTLYAVRHSDGVGDLETDLELIRNQEMRKHAHRIILLTEKEISNPAVYRDREILRARNLKNEKNNALALEVLRKFGGRARMFDIMLNMPDTAFSITWNAVWTLIDAGIVIHDHPAAKCTPISKLSWLRIAEGGRHAN
jgi:hypothetical protein